MKYVVRCDQGGFDGCSYYGLYGNFTDSQRTALKFPTAAKARGFRRCLHCKVVKLVPKS